MNFLKFITAVLKAYQSNHCSNKFAYFRLVKFMKRGFSSSHLKYLNYLASCALLKAIKTQIESIRNGQRLKFKFDLGHITKLRSLDFFSKLSVNITLSASDSLNESNSQLPSTGCSYVTAF